MPDVTLPEAAAILQPPITPAQLRAIITALHIQATGHRHTGRPGHPYPVYPWGELSALHAALTPWLTRDTSQEAGTLYAGDSHALNSHIRDRQGR